MRGSFNNAALLYYANITRGPKGMGYVSPQLRRLSAPFNPSHLVYLTLESIPLVFTRLHNFNAGESGLVFISQIIGPAFGLSKYASLLLN